jgi:anti-sigma B factor antagonist
MPDDRFPVEVLEGVPVMAAPEEIDITNAEALRTALLKVAANGHRTLVVDMTRTQFCDASGLHALAAAHQQTQADGREVLLVIPGAAVLRVFALIGMDRMIPNFTSLAEALAFTDRRDDQPALACEPTTHPGLAQATGAAAPAPGGGLDR